MSSALPSSYALPPPSLTLTSMGFLEKPSSTTYEEEPPMSRIQRVKEAIESPLASLLASSFFALSTSAYFLIKTIVPLNPEVPEADIQMPDLEDVLTPSVKEFFQEQVQTWLIPVAILTTLGMLAAWKCRVSTLVPALLTPGMFFLALTQSQHGATHSSK